MRLTNSILWLTCWLSSLSVPMKTNRLPLPTMIILVIPFEFWPHYVLTSAIYNCQSQVFGNDTTAPSVRMFKFHFQEHLSVLVLWLAFWAKEHFCFDPTTVNMLCNRKLRRIYSHATATTLQTYALNNKRLRATYTLLMQQATILSATHTTCKQRPRKNMQAKQKPLLTHNTLTLQIRACVGALTSVLFLWQEAGLHACHSVDALDHVSQLFEK